MRGGTPAAHDSLVAKSIFVFGMYENQAQSEHLYGLRHQGSITLGRQEVLTPLSPPMLRATLAIALENYLLNTFSMFALL